MIMGEKGQMSESAKTKVLESLTIFVYRIAERKHTKQAKIELFVYLPASSCQ